MLSAWAPGPDVSIHAPAKGATRQKQLCASMYPMFQSTPPRRGRPKLLRQRLKFVQFQSTPPRRGRQSAACRSLIRCCFNPRPREGGDTTRRRMFLSGWFQSTPPRRGRPDGRVKWERHILFQSTPPRRGRPGLIHNIVGGCHGFNPRPREGGDATSLCFASLTCCFNPRPREGGDLAPKQHPERLLVFQSTPPRRGRQVHHKHYRFRGRVSIHAPAKGATGSLVDSSPWL